MIRSLSVAVLVAGATSMAVPAAAAPPSDQEFTFEASAGQFCDFPIVIAGRGKEKLIDVGNGAQISLSPKLKVTVTRTDTGATASYTVTGASHNTTSANGEVVTRATGRHLLFDPSAGLVVTRGVYTFTTGADGNNVAPLKRIGGPDPESVCATLLAA